MYVAVERLEWKIMCQEVFPSVVFAFVFVFCFVSERNKKSRGRLRPEYTEKEAWIKEEDKRTDPCSSAMAMAVGGGCRIARSVHRQKGSSIVSFSVFVNKAGFFSPSLDPTLAILLNLSFPTRLAIQYSNQLNANASTEHGCFIHFDSFFFSLVQFQTRRHDPCSLFFSFTVLFHGGQSIVPPTPRWMNGWDGIADL